MIEMSTKKKRKRKREDTIAYTASGVRIPTVAMSSLNEIKFVAHKGRDESYGNRSHQTNLKKMSRSWDIREALWPEENVYYDYSYGARQFI